MFEASCSGNFLWYILEAAHSWNAGYKEQSRESSHLARSLLRGLCVARKMDHKDDRAAVWLGLQSHPSRHIFPQHTFHFGWDLDPGWTVLKHFLAADQPQSSSIGSQLLRNEQIRKLQLTSNKFPERRKIQFFFHLSTWELFSLAALPFWHCHHHRHPFNEFEAGV